MGKIESEGRTMSYLYIISCAVLCVICLIGITSDYFHDNLIQRIALSGMVLSCAGFIYQMIEGKIPSNFELFVMSVSLYAVATTWKLSDGREKQSN